MAQQLTISEVDVAQAAATLAAGALQAAQPIETSEAAKLSDYAMEVFWRIFEAMRVGVEIGTVPVAASQDEGCPDSLTSTSYYWATVHRDVALQAGDSDRASSTLRARSRVPHGAR